MSGGFFGFDTALPEHRQAADRPNDAADTSKFQNASSLLNPFNLEAPEDEEMEVYTWGQGLDKDVEAADELNDATFGVDVNAIRGGQFSFGNEESFSSPAKPSKQSQSQRGPIASTASRYRPKVAADPFAFSEDDFYASRPVKKTQPKPKTKSSAEPVWTKPAGQVTSWGAAPSSTVKPSLGSNHAQVEAPGHIKSLEEIEAEFASMPAPSAAQAAFQAPAQLSGPPPANAVVTLEELERQMMEEVPQPLAQHQAQQQGPPREVTPTQIPGLAQSGYASQKAVLDSMFPDLGKSPGPVPPGQQQGQTRQSPAPIVPSHEELARQEHFQKVFEAKVQAMSKYNNLMGSSDKDFITRIQLSQLATSDPYISDFYAQVFSAMERSRRAHESGQMDRPTVVQIAAGFGFGVGGPAGNRFGKMGQNTMQKLSTQVKKLVESRTAHQKSTNTAALQGALGRVTRGGAAAPRPVLAIPTNTKLENRPASHLNQSTGIQRPPLTRKQIMYALEDLYTDVLELEQFRREAPPSTSVDDIEIWNAKCQVKVDQIWAKLMVQEPIEVSNPHPFISLLNPPKGQRILGRIILQLPDQKIYTLLSLLVVKFHQLDVVARAPPPPVTDASLLTKADRLDRAKREADTDGFLYNLVPAMDMAINKCKLGLLGGLLVAAVQRLDVVKIASTRPGVVLFTALLSKAQSLIRAPPPDPLNPHSGTHPDQIELEHFPRQFSVFLDALLPSLPDLFPSSIAAKHAFGPSAYLMSGENLPEKEGLEMERREAEVWGLAAALAVNSAEEEQTALVAALREKILHTVQGARNPMVGPVRAEMKLRNVNMFLNGLGLDAAMIE
ncbi:hypothetical protein CNBA6240 [Cryptococcus deneoformans B-3501A]|uniref:hypothetical protein n=1 Tax=Cryptococcus deneoformans (strain B-3501A) TaxID=283643 RepID=UPI000042DA37|nr:hypothetical protein CNBA6240 [Cryptococcus neoformans var. neoformans B-3501A]EAL23099.1 hypothetical protein CNBA6240 [Cryptococcus neoformans var. neoformans B-3501A]